jgi:hypothetical protein
MRNQSTSSQQTMYEFLGVWETAWLESAARARKAERYYHWLRSQGIARDEAAGRAVRVLVTQDQQRASR